MRVVLVTEIPESGEHGIRRGFTGYLLQVLQIVALSLAGTQVLKDGLGPGQNASYVNRKFPHIAIMPLSFPMIIHCQDGDS